MKLFHKFSLRSLKKRRENKPINTTAPEENSTTRGSTRSEVGHSGRNSRDQNTTPFQSVNNRVACPSPVLFVANTGGEILEPGDSPSDDSTSTSFRNSQIGQLQTVGFQL